MGLNLEGLCSKSVGMNQPNSPVGRHKDESQYWVVDQGEPDH